MMEDISNRSTLEHAIAALKLKHIREGAELREQVGLAFQSIRPINIIKSTFEDMGSDPQIRHKLIGGALGLAGGFLSKKIILGKTRNPVSSIVGHILQFAIGSLVAKNSDKIIKSGEHLLHNMYDNGDQPS